MKIFLILIGIVLITFSCKKDEVSISDLVGKWNPTYQIKEKNGNWHTINTNIALPNYEFTADGRFLVNGASGDNCCIGTGNKYELKYGKLVFSDIGSCASVLCMTCDGGFQLVNIDKDTLILSQCSTWGKHVRKK